MDSRGPLHSWQGVDLHGGRDRERERERESAREREREKKKKKLNNKTKENENSIRLACLLDCFPEASGTLAYLCKTGCRRSTRTLYSSVQFCVQICADLCASSETHSDNMHRTFASLPLRHRVSGLLDGVSIPWLDLILYTVTLVVLSKLVAVATSSDGVVESNSYQG